MTEERIDIVLADKVSDEPARKIQFLATQARDAHSALTKLREQLTQINATSVRKLQEEMTASVTQTTRQATALERLEAAQARTATAVARLERAQAQATTATLQGAVAAQRLTTEQERTERSTLATALAKEKLETATRRNTAAQQQDGDAAVKLWQQNEKMIEQSRRAQAASAAQAQYNAVLGVTPATSGAAKTSMGVFAQDARDKAAAATATADLERRTIALKSAIDPVYAAQLQYNRTVAESTALLKAGTLTQADHARVVGMATQTLRAHGGVQGQVADATKLTRFQMLTLQYTINDVAASLASGASPFTILMQQGGQVTQAWGGLGATLKALGGALLSTTGLVVGALAAFAGIFLLTDRAKADMAGVQRQLDLTSGSAGLTAGQFLVMSEGIAKATRRSVGDARDVASAWASSGQLQAMQIDQLSTATLNFSKLSGDSTDKVQASWAKLTDAPAKFAKEMLQHYGVFTAAQVDHIRMLEEQGRKTQAVDEVSRRMYEYYGKEAPSNLSKVGAAWQAITRAIDDTFAAMKRLMRNDTIQEQLAAAQATVDKYQATINNKPAQMTGKDFEKRAQAMMNLQDAKDQVAALQEQVNLEKIAADEVARLARNQKLANDAADELNSITAATADNFVRFTNAVTKYDQIIKNLRGADDPKMTALADTAQANRAKVIEGYRKQFLPHATAETEKYRAAMQELNQEMAKATAAGGLLREETLLEKFTYATTEGTLRKLAKGEKDEILLLAQQADAVKLANVVREKNEQVMLKAADAQQKITKITSDDFNARQNQLMQYEFETSMIGKTRDEITLLTAARQIDMDRQKRVADLGATYGDRDLDAAYYRELNAIYANADALKTKLIPAMKERNVISRSWVTGATEAYNEYIDATTDAAKQGKALWSSMYRGMEDDAFNFFNKGTLSAENFITSIETGLARLAAQTFTVMIAGQLGIDGVNGVAAGVTGSTVGTGLGAYLAGASGISGMASSFAAGWSAAAGQAAGTPMIAALATEGAAGTAAGLGSSAYATLSAIPAAGWIALAVVAAYEVFHKNYTSAMDLSRGTRAYDAQGTLTGSSNDLTLSGASTADKVLKGLGDGYSGMLRSLGMTGAAASFGFASNTGREGQNPNFTLSAQVGGKSYKTVTDNADLFAANEMAMTPASIQLEVSRVLLTALTESTLPKSLQGVFDDIVPATMTQSEIDAVLATAQSFADLHTQLQALPFESLKDLSYSAAQALVTAAGGMQTLGTNLGSFYQNFYSDAERTANLTATTTAAFTALGLTMPTMDSGARAAYRAMVEEASARDLSVTANARAYASLLALNGAVNTLAPAAESAAVAVRSAADILNERTRLQDQLDNLTMTSAELLTKQRNALDASNQSLFDQVQTAQAAKDAADALAQSFKDAEAAAATLAATNKNWQDQLDILLGTQTEQSIALRDAGDDTTRTLMRQVYAQQALKDATAASSDAMQTLINDVAAAVNNVHASVTNSAFDMRYGLQDAAGQYGMLDVQAKRLDDLMRSSTDINQIAKYAQDEIDTINKAFALLDPSQQQGTLNQNILLLDKIDSYVTGAGADALSLRRAEYADLSASVTTAFDNALKTLAEQLTAATLAQINAQIEAGDKIAAAVRAPIQVKLSVSAPRGSEVSIQ